MVCAFCAQGIHKSMMAQDGIESVEVDLDSKEVRLDLEDGATLDEAFLRKIIGDAGYAVKEIRYEK